MSIGEIIWFIKLLFDLKSAGKRLVRVLKQRTHYFDWKWSSPSDNEEGTILFADVIAHHFTHLYNKTLFNFKITDDVNVTFYIDYLYIRRNNILEVYYKELEGFREKRTYIYVPWYDSDIKKIMKVLFEEFYSIKCEELIIRTNNVSIIVDLNSSFQTNTSQHYDLRSIVVSTIWWYDESNLKDWLADSVINDFHNCISTYQWSYIDAELRKKVNVIRKENATWIIPRYLGKWYKKCQVIIKKQMNKKIDKTFLLELIQH